MGRKETSTPLSPLNTKPLNALRACAALLVVLSHLANVNIGVDAFKGTGQHGVILFFCISGFLMGYLYVFSECFKTTSEWIIFYTRRAARILPLYMLVIITSYTLSNFTTFDGAYEIDLPELIRLLTFQSDFSVFWTLAVEIKFYLIFPFIALLLGSLPNSARPIACAAILLLLFSHEEKGSSKIALIRNLTPFLVGIMGSQIALTKLNWKHIHCNIGFLLTMSLLFYGNPTTLSNFFVQTPSVWQHQLIFSTLFVMLILFSLRVSGVVERLLSNRVFQTLGDLSFGIYLIHMIILWTLYKEFSIRSESVLFTGVITGAVAISMMIYRFIEKPIMQKCRMIGLSKRRDNRSPM